MTETSPTDELRAEHDSMRARMSAFADAVARLKSGESVPWADAGADLRGRAAALQQVLHLHFRKEEEGLFPDVLSMVSRGAPRVDILTQFFGEEADDDLKAHTLLRARMKNVLALVAEAEQAGRFDGESAARLATLAGLSRDLLERHAGKEHELVFPMIERLLDESQMAAVRERIRGIARAEQEETSSR